MFRGARRIDTLLLLDYPYRTASGVVLDNCYSDLPGKGESQRLITNVPLRWGQLWTQLKCTLPQSESFSFLESSI